MKNSGLNQGLPDSQALTYTTLLLGIETLKCHCKEKDIIVSIGSKD